MLENEFEKHVREMMEDFKISPSGSVWDKVEQQIPTEKRRRRWLPFIFLFAAISLSGYLFYRTYYNASSPLKVVANVQRTQDKTRSNKDTAENGQRVASNVTRHGMPANKNQGKMIDKDLGKNVPSFAKGGQNAEGEQPKNAVPAAITAAAKDLAEPDAERNSNDQRIVAADSTEAISLVPSPDGQQKDSLHKADLKDSTQRAIAPAAHTRQTVNKRWEFGVAAFYGRSNVFENFLGIKFDDNASSLVPGRQSTSGFVRNAGDLNKKVQEKGAFSIGVVAKRRLSSKSEFTIGLQYSKFQTEVETGGMQDSTITFRYNNLTAAPTTIVNHFYKPGTGDAYTNHYDFIQVPVLFEHSITKSRSLNWNAGLSLSSLIASNGLVFDRYNVAYYNNNDLFKKTQITFLGGINTRFNLGRSTVDLGPQFQYGLTNLFRRNAYGKQHLFTWGAQVHLFLRK